MKNLLFFMNPAAGHGEIRDRLMDVLQILSSRYRVTVHPTRGPGDLTDVIVREGRNYDVIVSIGGDGTLNETTSGLMQLAPEERPLVGYIPGGTVNDVASTLGLSKNILKASENILDGVPFAMDVGSFNDRWFNYVAAFGVFTDVAYRTSQEDKRLLGRLAYLLDGVKSLSEIRPTEVEITVDGVTSRESVLIGLVTSTTSVGGFNLKGRWDVALNDGLFEILLLRNIKSLKDLSDVVSALARQDLTEKHLLFRKASHVEFRFPHSVGWTLDGEFGGSVTRAVIDTHPKAVSLLIPQEKTK